MLELTDVMDAAKAHWILSLITLLFTLIFLHYIISFGQIRSLGLPGPTPFPVFGDLRVLLDRGEIHITVDRYLKQYGKVFGFYLIKDPTIVVSDPEMLKEITVKGFNNFHAFTTLGFEFGEPMNSMMSMTTGERWKNIRSSFTPAFSTGKLKGVMPLMNDSVKTFMKKCKIAAETKETFDMYKWIQGVTLETILATTFGVKSETQTNPDDIMAKYAWEALNRSKWIGVIAMVPLIGSKLAKQLMPTTYGMGYGNLQSVTMRMIKQRKSQGVGDDHKEDFIDMMLATQNPDRNAYTLTDNEVIAQCLGFLMAGHDTTSATLAMTCYNLAIHPEVQDKIQKEIDTVCLENAADYKSLHEMVYLDAVISETLRLYTPAPFTVRKVTKSCEVNGYQFPKDLSVLIPVYSLHHDPKYWDEPEEFRPERFLPGNKESIDPFTYLPFGQGPRNCVGKRFALLEVKLVLARLLQEFRIEKAADLHVPIKMSMRSTYQPVEPISVQVKKRRE